MEWAISCVLGSRWDLEGRAEELAVLGGSNKKEAKAGMIRPGHASILAGRIPSTEEPGTLQPIGSQRVGHN